ncbi:MAG: DUF4783 domain-containing protein [Bacteroidota bacterium]
MCLSFCPRLVPCAWGPLAGLMLLVMGLQAGTASPAWAQRSGPGAELVEQVTAGFQQSDARRVLASTAERVEMGLLRAGTLYSQAQARYILDAFFADHPPRRVTFKAPARSDGNWFVAGSYWPQGADAPFHLYLRLQELEATWVLREVRIARPRE